MVAKMTFKVILSLATNHDWELQEFSVRNALLHGDLEEVHGLPSGYEGHVVS